VKRALLIGGAALALCSTLVMAQQAPESLLPPGFDDPAPAPTPTPRPTGAPTPTATGTPVVQPIPGVTAPALPSAPVELPPGLPSIEELEAMDADELDELLGLKPRYDIPPAAQRSTEQVGLLAPDEGGLPTASLRSQPAAIVAAALAGTRQPLVSRWGHIMLRRALASRLEAPRGMDPVDFAALRARVLNDMGEFSVARALVQDVDTGNWNRLLTNAAFDAYVATGDLVGICPAVQVAPVDRDDAQWTMAESICAAFSGQGARAGQELNRALGRGIADPIDVLLAQRYAGAAGFGRRAVNLEWDNVEEMTPWRFALATAVGAEIPETLLANPTPYIQRVSAVSPALPLTQRALGADLAAREGILSSTAYIDLYSALYAQEQNGGEGEMAQVAARLRNAYVAPEPAARLAAMREIWGGAEPDYARLVLTAYAAARLEPNEEFLADAPLLIASMLAAGLERDAMRWASVLPQGSQGWALLALAQPTRDSPVSSGQLGSFVDDDASAGQRKSQFLLAGLAGLGRLEQGTVGDYAENLGVNLGRQTRWSRLIDAAADAGNPALVAMLAGVGMQGSGWDKMTPRHLYHIVSALGRVGMEAEARMIAAEAVARG
jgi:hypothetical protein